MFKFVLTVIILVSLVSCRARSSGSHTSIKSGDQGTEDYGNVANSIKTYEGESVFGDSADQSRYSYDKPLPDGDEELGEDDADASGSMATSEDYPVCIFEGDNYNGVSLCLQPSEGMPKLANLNDKVSSVQIRSGSCLFANEKRDGKGDFYRFLKSEKKLGIGADNRISSLYVRQGDDCEKGIIGPTNCKHSGRDIDNGQVVPFDFYKKRISEIVKCDHGVKVIERLCLLNYISESGDLKAERLKPFEQKLAFMLGTNNKRASVLFECQSEARSIKKPGAKSGKCKASFNGAGYYECR